MLTQSLPRSAEAYQRAQHREIAAAVAAVRALWRRMSTEFDPSFAALLPSLLGVVGGAQGRVAEGSAAYVPAVLAETGQGRAVAAAADVAPEAFVGYAGDGRPLDGLLEGAKVHAKQAVGAGRTPVQALAAGGQWLTMAVGTVLSDTGRSAERVAMAVRPVGGYVRMLNPPSCSRCAVLAGRVYPSSAPFARHPGCDCRHIPASESVANELTVDSRAYFDSLDRAEQDRIFTKAGAEAIREGADIGRVVNARRGMAAAGHTQTATREMWVRKPDGSVVWERRTVNVTRRTLTPRKPMPETLRTVATDKADYLRLLKANGYIK